MRKFLAGRLSALIFAVSLIAVSVFGTVSINTPHAYALEFGNRSVQLSDYTPSAISDYDFTFFVPTNTNIGSIDFVFCSNSPVFDQPCTAPAGLDVTAAVPTTEIGNTAFVVDGADTTANDLIISRPSAAGSITATEIAFSGITNPSAAGNTVFVRISTHAASDGSGPINDSGAVAYVTSATLNVSAQVPPFLRICVGLSVAPDCSSQSGDSLDLGDLSTGHASSGVSQFGVGTNSPSGYVVYALGTTLTSGNDAIPSLSLPAPSFPGNDQFGINLRANSNPANGQDPGGFGTGVPTANYDTPDQFVFNSGDAIATSALPSDYNRMTVTYLINVNAAQNIGIYSTTITYVATGDF